MMAAASITEEDVIVFDPPTPEKVQESTTANNTWRTFQAPGSSSSDTDDEPVVKKKRATRTQRQYVSETNFEEAPDCAVYTGHISDIFRNARPPTSADNDPEAEIEEEDEDITMKKRTIRGRDRTKKPDHRRAEKLDSIISSDDDDILILDSESPIIDRDRSPTPPPDHLEYGQVRCRTRTTKGSKKAIGNLNTIRGRLRMEHFVSGIEAPETPVLNSPEKRNLIVKIRTVHGIERVKMQLSDTFEGVIEEMSDILKTEKEKIIIYHGDKVVEGYETPKCLKLTVADILDCHVVTNLEGAIGDLDDSLLGDDPTMIRLCIQSQRKSRHQDPVKIKIKKKMPLEKLMRQYAQQSGEAYEKLTFYFDGEVVKPSDTAERLDMDEDDCLDVTST